MKTYFHYLTILLLSSLFSVRSAAQDGIVGSGGDGTGSGGSFSYSFGQFSYENYFEATGSVAQGVQHPFEFNDLLELVPENLSVADRTITSGELLCYNAMGNITVAGEGHPVTIQSSAVVDFIAGHSIRFLPGFTARSGSVVQGSITTDNSFCEGSIVPSIVESPAEKKDIEIEEAENTDGIISPEMKVTLYPNPNSGRFNITLANFENLATVRVYNLLGSVFYESSLTQTTQNEINVPWLRKGIYVVQVNSNNKQFIKKIIVN